MRRFVHCFVCKKLFKYTKSMNKHIRKNHPKELYKIENEPFDITKVICSAEMWSALNES